MTALRLGAVMLALAVVTVACIGPPPADADASGLVMAAALRQVATVDHTFGDGPPPFTEYLIQANTDPAAGAPDGTDGQSRPLTPSEMAAIEAAFDQVGPMRWVEDPADWITEDLIPTVEGAVILGVGEPRFESADSALVPVSLWCGGLCGTWLTYRVERRGDTWAVTDIEGPVSIS